MIPQKLSASKILRYSVCCCCCFTSHACAFDIFINNDLPLHCSANLSRDYFVDRQDRYTWFQNCPQLTDYFAELVTTTCSHSFTLKPDGATEAPSSVATDPLSSRQAAQEFRTSLHQAISDLIQKQHPMDEDSVCGEGLNVNGGLDTVVFPLVQMGYYNIRQDEKVTEELFEGLSDGDRLCLASGYFNLPPSYVEALLEGRGDYHILAASPQVSVHCFTMLYAHNAVSRYICVNYAVL